MIPDIGDVIELITTIPEKNLNAGLCGTVVHCHGNDIYEIEFINKKGETINFLSLHKKHFMVAWRAETKQWIPIAEQTSSIVAGMPDDVAKQVLDFARFLFLRNCKST